MNWLHFDMAAVAILLLSVIGALYAYHDQQRQGWIFSWVALGSGTMLVLLVRMVWVIGEAVL